MTPSPFELLGERFGSLTKGSARVENSSRAVAGRKIPPGSRLTGR